MKTSNLDGAHDHWMGGSGMVMGLELETKYSNSIDEKPVWKHGSAEPCEGRSVTEGTSDVSVGACSGPGVLVVDDDEQVGRSMKILLERAGFTTRYEKTGAKALQALREGSFFAVIMDVIMPDMDGLELLLQVKKNHPGLCAIAVSGSGAPLDYLDIAIKFGANDSIRKPFDALALIEMVSKQQCFWQLHKSDPRRFVRVPVALEGFVLDTEGWECSSCQILDLSIGGALVTHKNGLKVGSKQLLHVTGFGRFEARVAHQTKCHVGLEFLIGLSEQKRLGQLLSRYVMWGMEGVSDLRRNLPPEPKKNLQITTAGGELIQCIVTDPGAYADHPESTLISKP